MLSRVLWPPRPLEKVLSALQKNNQKFQRICIQAVNYPGFVNDLLKLVKNVKEVSGLPISLSSPPVARPDLEKLASLGVDRICMPLDAATPEIFGLVKGGHRWQSHLKALADAREIFGPNVTTHMIIGLGESEREAVQTIGTLNDQGILVGLFAFTPIKGTPLSENERPRVDNYRRIQLARYLISQHLVKVNDIKFQDGKVADFGVGADILRKVVRSGEPFRTSGCPGCNRPFYNESPQGPIYNYPRKPTRKQIEEIENFLFKQ
jgi:biotin synthase